MGGGCSAEMRRPCLEPAGQACAAAANAGGEPPGVILLGTEAFQRQAIEDMLDPAGVPLLARLDPSSTPHPALRQLVSSLQPGGLLVVEGKGLQRLLRQRRRQSMPALRTLVVAPLDELPAVLHMLVREQLLESLAGCITPERMRQEGVAILSLTMQGMTVLPRAALTSLLEGWRPGARLGMLNADERNLLAFLSTGASDKEIAAAAGMPLSRVRNLVRNVLGKLGCRSRTAAAVLAFRHSRRLSRQRRSE